MAKNDVSKTGPVTRRQHEMLVLATRAMCPAEIARQLGVSRQAATETLHRALRNAAAAEEAPRITLRERQYAISQIRGAGEKTSGDS